MQYSRVVSPMNCIKIELRNWLKTTMLDCLMRLTSSTHLRLILTSKEQLILRVGCEINDCVCASASLRCVGHCKVERGGAPRSGRILLCIINSTGTLLLHYLIGHPSHEKNWLCIWEVDSLTYMYM